MQNTKKAPNKGVRLLLIVFGGILAVMLLAAAALFVIPLTERVDAAPVAGSADWMAMLPDDVPLGELSIPGTHDAGTGCGDAVCAARLFLKVPGPERWPAA